MNLKKGLFFKTALLLIILNGTLLAGERLDLPEGVFYYQPSAAVFGSEATWVNPAGLGTYYPAGFQIMFDHYNGEFAKDWGGVISGERIALAYRNLDREGGDFREYVFATGFPFGKRATLGFSYRYFQEGPGYFNNRHLWNIGLISRYRKDVSFSALWSNLNRGRIDGERTKINHRYGMALRPLGKKLTLAADMLFATGDKIKDADYIFHLEYTPQPGLYINGYYDTDDNFQVGVRFNLTRYFFGAKARFDKDAESRGTTVFVGANALRQPSLINYAGRRLNLGLGGRLAENPPRPVFGHRRTSFATLITQIYRAADDRSVDEMALYLNGFSMSLGQAQELRKALVHFKNNHKKITCYLSNPNNMGYYIGSATDAILIPPVSQLNLVGLRAELTFYAGTLDKLGVKVDMVSIGDYKTAPERLTRKDASPENQQQINYLLDETYEQFVAAIARGRGIAPDSVKAIIDNGPYTSEDALGYGLVDGLSYRDELKGRYLKAMPEISFSRYVADTLENDEWGKKPVIAVVVAEGEIQPGSNHNSPFGNSTEVTPSLMKQGFRQALAEDNVAGIVFRINSPGGYALAGEAIYHEAEKAAERKALVVSMAGVAASGGYYIAMPAEYLFANPGTITGSIGIYGGKPDFSGLYKKIDLGKEIYTRGKFAGMLSTMRPFTDAEREKFRSSLEAFYGFFLRLVADSRGLEVDSVGQLAQGKVWSGRDAIEIGLVDEAGGLHEALEYIARRKNLKDYTVKIYPEKRPLFVFPAYSLLDGLAKVFAGDKEFTDEASSILDWSEEEVLLTRMPFDLDIQ